MRQVLSNLISNAIEATASRGRIVIRIRAAHRWAGRETRGLRLSIGDNGTGIPAEVRRRLGEPFFTTKGQSGTGLGLWVTRSIVHRYGGNLQLRSSVSPQRHGTVFSLFLPANLPANMKPVTMFPGTGEAEDTAAAGTSTPRWHGLRLIRQGTTAENPTADSAQDAHSKDEASPTSKTPSVKPRPNDHWQVSGD